jgi:hypothetical protein
MALLASQTEFQLFWAKNLVFCGLTWGPNFIVGMDTGVVLWLGCGKLFLWHNQNLPLKNQHSDKDEEICCHQPSSPAAASRCPVTQILPSTFVAVVAKAVAVGVAWWW